jgi:hypothetical protein
VRSPGFRPVRISIAERLELPTVMFVRVAMPLPSTT